MELENKFLYSNEVDKNSPEMAMFEGVRVDTSEPVYYRQNGNIAEIDVVGFLRNEKYYWSSGTSYNDIIRGIREANDSPEIDEINFIVDSNGGNVGIVDIVWREIFNSPKPTKAIVSGNCCSAAYYIACACDKIVSMSPTNLIGSIGVIVTGIDASKYYKELGIKFVNVTSDNAPKKALGIDSKEGIEEIKKIVNALEAAFIDRVSIGRGKTAEYVAENFGRGGVMVAYDLRNKKNATENKKGSIEIDALSVGMLDSVETKDGLVISNNGESEEYMEKDKKTEAGMRTISDAEYADLMKIKARQELESEMKQKEEEKANMESKEKEEKAKADYALACRNVASILASASYPASVREIGMKVFDNSASYSDFTAAVEAADKEAEKKRLEAAENEDDIGSQAASTSENKPGEVIKDEETFAAAKSLFEH